MQAGRNTHIKALWNIGQLDQVPNVGLCIHSSGI